MSAEPATLCPRCDYDLCGQVATWQQECPLTGTCSECGLDFVWREVFRPAFTIPDWSYEHAEERGVGGGAWRLVRTLLMMAAPRRFWRTLPLGAPTHWWRAAFVSLAGFVAAYVLMAVMAAALIAANGWLRQQDLAAAAAMSFPSGPIRISSGTVPTTVMQSLHDEKMRWLLPFRAAPQVMRNQYLLGVLAGVACMLVGPCFALLPFTLRRQRVHPRHVARIALYGLWLVPIAASIYSIVALTWRLFDTMAYHSGWFHGSGWTGPDQPWGSLAVWFRTHEVQFTVVCFLGLVWVWWGLAASRYLKIPRPWFTSGVLVFVAALATLVGAYFTPALWRDVVELLKLLT